MCRLDEQPARVSLTLAGDVPHPRPLLAGLAHTRIKPEIAHEVARRREPPNVADDAD